MSNLNEATSLADVGDVTGAKSSVLERETCAELEVHVAKICLVLAFLVGHSELSSGSLGLDQFPHGFIEHGSPC